jgi:hypothetical protein
MSFLTVVYSVSLNKDKSITIKNSQGDTVTSFSPKVLLDFLGKNYTDAINRKAFWDIDQAMAPVLKTLGVEVCEELVKEPNCEVRFRFSGSGEIALIGFTDIKEPLPADAYSLFYHRKNQAGIKIPTEKWASHIYSTVNHTEDDEDINDVQEILKRTDIAINAYRDGLHLNPMKWSSPVSVYEDNVLKNISLPNIADIPMPLEDIDEYVAWCEEVKDREYTTNLAVGRWLKGETYNYDIQSAFGYEFSQLYDFRYSTFTKSDKPVKDAQFGLLKGLVTIYDGVKVSPICYLNKNGQTIYPTGCSWEDKLTLEEVRWIYHHKIGEFKMDYGFFQKQNAPVQPFKISMQRIFDNREQGGLVKKLAKRIGASAWSKCIQRANSKDNPYYAPNFAMQVKTHSRLKVADFIYDNNLQDSVLSIATDGVRASKSAKATFKYGLGEWREEAPDACIILSPSQMITPTKKPRSIFYDEMIELINEKPDSTYYADKRKRRETLAEAVDEGHLERVGDIIDMGVSIDLLMARLEQDYKFDDFPMCGKDLLNKKYYGQPVGVN